MLRSVNADDYYESTSKVIAELVGSAQLALNIGCGDFLCKGFVNVDLYNPAADVNASAADLPYEDGTVDLIMSSHLLEHLTRDEGRDALREWRRVLVPGGSIIIICPDIRKACHVGASCSPEFFEREVMRWIYGESALQGMAHKTGYSPDLIERFLDEEGWTVVEVYRDYPLRPSPSFTVIAATS